MRMSQSLVSYLIILCELQSICVLITSTEGQNVQIKFPDNPCHLFFKYKSNNNNRYEGQLTIKFPINDVYVNISVHAATREQLTNSYNGYLELINSQSGIQQDLEYGRPLKYRIHFPSESSVPQITAIFYNNQQLCGGPKGADFTNEYELQHKLLTIFDKKGSNITVHEKTTLIKEEESANNSDSCGKSTVDSITSLIIGGSPLIRGEFPWLIAYYNSIRGNFNFVCGGSLVSNRAVITAAHCIINKKESVSKKPENAIIFIGKHNLESIDEEGSIKQRASKFIIHPDWKTNDIKYDADIAIIIIEKVVEFTNYIQPVCLWNKKDDIFYIVGKMGTVAGWGKNVNLQFNSKHPKLLHIPIVSEGECLRAADSFVYITSPRTFCAGARDGQSDSGGGLMLFEDGRFFLRGVVSASLRDPITGCDANNYAVFTDVAKFIDWIKQNM